MQSLKYKHYWRDVKAEAEQVSSYLFMSETEVVDMNWIHYNRLNV